MIKSRSQQVKSLPKKNINKTDIDALADKIADKPYGKEKNNTEEKISESDTQEMERITITVPLNMSYVLDDMARERKRNKLPNRTVSAIVREALDEYIRNKKS